MINSDIILYAWLSLRGYPARTLLMLLAISISVASVLLLTALGEGARRYVNGEFSSLGTHLVIVLEKAVLSILAGEGGGLRVYGLDRGGLELVALREEVSPGSQCTILEHPEVMDMARELRRQLVAGEVGIEDPMGVL